MLVFFVHFFYIQLSYASPPGEKPFVVVIDAGHGGKDPGNTKNGFYEKNIALKIALKIGKELKGNSNVKVIYTRKTDVFVELIKRANIANEADADLFVSIHCNSFHSARAFGVETFVLGLHRSKDNFNVAQKENSVIFLEDNYEQTYNGFDPNDPESVISLLFMQETYLEQSILAADVIQQSFIKNLNRKDRTVKQAGFLVLRNTYMPSVLVEIGFLSNLKEGAFLNSTKGQSKIASAIAKAILDYKDMRQNSVQTENVFDLEEELSDDKEEDIYFRIQISASKKSIESKPHNFKGLKGIYKEKDDVLYRYYYGKTRDYSQAKKNVRKAKRKGFKSAFIRAFKNGEKIKIEEALKKDE